MTSEKQLEANRRNALLLTKAKTEAGRKASRMNAIRHGLTGKIDVNTPEDREAHNKFCAAIVASLAPAPGIEQQFALSVAEDHWRLNRARSIENKIFTLVCSFEAAARTFIADLERFQLLTTYERRIHRNMTKSLKQLTELQSTRRAQESAEKEQAQTRRGQAFDEACLLTQLAEMEGVPCDPATDYPDPNGFVFSTREIVQSIRRETRLQTANARFRSSLFAVPGLRKARVIPINASKPPEPPWPNPSFPAAA